MRRADTWKNVAAGVIATLLFFAALEIAARVTEPPPPWARVAVPPPKEPGSYRVLVLGGSTVLGSPLPEIGFVAQLEHALRRAAPDATFDVINLGRGGKPAGYVRRVLDRVIDANPDVVVVLTAHNEFMVRPSVAPVVAWVERHLRLTRFFHVAVERFTGRRPGRGDVLPDRLVPCDRRAPWFVERLERYRRNVEGIVATARSRNVPLILLTAPSNTRDWPPVHENIAWASSYPDYDQTVARLEGLLEDRNLRVVEVETARLLDAYGPDAMVLHLRGRALYDEQRFVRAAPLLVEAKDRDPYPWRALEEQNVFLRTFVGREGVIVVDADSAFKAVSRGGVVGFDLICDNVHPTPLGCALTAFLILRTMASEGLVVKDAALPATHQELFQAFRTDHGERWRELETEWGLACGTYCMKTPFYDYAAARRYLRYAQARDPDRWEIHANLGVVSLLEGRTEEGIALLRHATTLKGSPLDPEDRGALPYLKEALARSGAGLPGLDD